MKNSLLLIVFILTSSYSVFSQELSNTPCIQCEAFIWKNGYDQDVEVEVRNLNLTEEDISQEVFNNLGVEIMVKAKFKLKNRLSFVPKKLTLMKMQDGRMVATVLMYGKNGYGVEDEVRANFYFTADGKITREL